MMINKRLINMVSDSKKHIIKQVVVNWVSLLCNISIIVSISVLLQHIILGLYILPMILSILGIIVVCIIIRFLCAKHATKQAYLASVNVKKILRDKIYHKLLKLGPSYHEHISTSEVVQLSVEGTEQLETYFGRYLPQLFYSLLAPITLFVVLSFINFKAALILLLCVPLIPVSIIAVQKFAKKLLKKYWGIYIGLGDSFLENLQGLTTLKIYQADERKNQEMNEQAETFRKITMKVLTMQLNSVTIMDVIAFGGAAIGVIISISELMQGRLPFWGALSIILLSSEFFIPLRLLGSFFHIAMNGMAASEKIFKLLDLPNSPEQTKTIDLFDITLKNVSFSYNPERKILNDISLSIPQGAFVSIVGESGCGKSTIASLLSSLNKGYSGSIQIGNTELSEINEAELMEHITTVTHNNYIFKGTVKENLLYGNPYASADQMEQILKQVNLYKFITSQGGLAFQLNEKGSNLSGGQCQRLALAGALLHDSAIYIFDEATSNIDVESEEIIMREIHKLAKQKSVLLISHRLANVIPSDCVYVVENGFIAESGTHEDLLNVNGIYAKLFETQQQLENYSKEVTVHA